MKNIIEHYDKLIEENNDPVHDPYPLKEYMDKWDGDLFIENLHLQKDKSVLEIGVGTGRLAIRVAPLCGSFLGIDISPKTINRASDNLSSFDSVTLICDDFMSFEFYEKFDIIYSSLTFMHIEDKRFAIKKIASLLNNEGRFVLSIDKNQSGFIDMGMRRVKIYPDNPIDIYNYLLEAKLDLTAQFETEHAYVMIAIKPS